MHRFEYRLPRLTTGFNVEFIAGEEILHGRCNDVSQAGIRAEFAGPVAVGSTGILVLRHPTQVLRLKAQVAYFEDAQTGFSFLFQSAQERVQAMQLVAAIAKNPCAH